MKHTTYKIRNGFDKKTCIVHARCCVSPREMFATAQNLTLSGCDLFSPIMLSKSADKGKTWSDFSFQNGLSAIPMSDDKILVGCDATPMYHKKTDTILLLGHTACYSKSSLSPYPHNRQTFYSTMSNNETEFSKMHFVGMPEEYSNGGNGSGQSIELENGDILIPIYYKPYPDSKYYSAVMQCSFDSRCLKFIKIGNSLTISDEPRGIYEPSVIKYKNEFYMTLRGDNFGYTAKSADGLNYTGLQKWTWDNGEILQNYNTQQHWFTANDSLYLVYTRRGADNDHVFRHRAPLFVSKVKTDTNKICLEKKTEFIAVPQRGARLGNFGVTQDGADKAFIMAAEWMQPIGCEKYGSDNAIFICKIN